MGQDCRRHFAAFIDALGGETPTDWEVLEPTKAHMRFFSKEASMEGTEPIRGYLSSEPKLRLLLASLCMGTEGCVNSFGTMY